MWASCLDQIVFHCDGPLLGDKGVIGVVLEKASSYIQMTLKWDQKKSFLSFCPKSIRPSVEAIMAKKASADFEAKKQPRSGGRHKTGTRACRFSHIYPPGSP